MTLRSKDGQLSLAKIGVLCGILGAIATCVMAMPTAIGYAKTAMAPWMTLPAQIEALRQDNREMKSDIKDIKEDLSRKPSLTKN